MTKRLTNKWTKNSAGAYGKLGHKGDIGEAYALEYLKHHPEFNYPIVHHKTDTFHQTEIKCDITVQKLEWIKPVRIEVKHNIKFDKCGIELDTPKGNSPDVPKGYGGWMHRSFAERIMHVCTEQDIIFMYNRPEVAHYFREARPNLRTFKDKENCTLYYLDIMSPPQYILKHSMLLIEGKVAHRGSETKHW